MDHWRLLGRHTHRMVRFLSLRRARAVFQQAFLLAGVEPNRRLYRQSLCVLDGFSRSAFRRDPFRPSRRPDRPQIHLHADLGVDGNGDLCRRPAAGLCADRGARTDPLGLHARPAGSCLGRRIWRCGDLHRRALARRQTRLLYQLDPDHGDDGDRPGALGHPDLPTVVRRPGVQRLGLARPVPALRDPRCAVGLHPTQARGIPTVRPPQKSKARRRPTRRPTVSSAAARIGV